MVIPAQSQSQVKDKIDLELASGWAVPEFVAAEVKEDPRVGLNVHLRLRNFDFAPARVGDRSATTHGESRAYGFVHLYINGRKKNRMYGPDFYLKEDWLKEPVNRVEFVLGTPGYGKWLHKGEPIVGAVMVKKPVRKSRPSRKPKKKK